LKVNEIGGGRNILSPKVRRKRGNNHQRMSCLKHMAMLALSHAILSMSARTGELSKSPLLGEKSAQHLGDILPSRISSKHTNRCGELGVNHGSKSLIDRENLATRIHEVNPGIARVIIDKNNIVAMAPLRTKGSWTAYIRMYQIKRMLQHGGTSRIG
jgi:hypothetical protein